MPQDRPSKYEWPASALTKGDMALLHAARESSRPRIPISDLIAQAIRAQYANAVLPIQQLEPIATQKAA